MQDRRMDRVVKPRQRQRRGQAAFLWSRERVAPRWEQRLLFCLRSDGCLALWAMVMQDAVSLLLGTGVCRRERNAHGQRSPAAVREWRRAMQWILRRGDDTLGEIGTFEWVCNELGIDAEICRADLCARIAASPRTAEFAPEKVSNAAA
jgi:hypothetical protein